MVAGREIELRERVAREVMGFHDKVTQDDWPHWGVDEEGCMYPRLPMYDEDIGDAWEVVEKLDNLGFSMTAEWDASERRWFVGFSNEVSYKAGEADTAPVAICLAALAAVGAPAETPVPEGGPET